VFRSVPAVGVTLLPGRAGFQADAQRERMVFRSSCSRRLVPNLFTFRIFQRPMDGSAVRSLAGLFSPRVIHLPSLFLLPASGPPLVITDGCSPALSVVDEGLAFEKRPSLFSSRFSLLSLACFRYRFVLLQFCRADSGQRNRLV